MTFSDVDAGSDDLTVTLSTATGGQLSATSGSGITVGGTATARTFTGSLSDLNTYFNTATNLQYLHGTANTNGDDADTISVVINDIGNNGVGGGTNQAVGVVNVDIDSINDAPQFSVPGAYEFDQQIIASGTDANGVQGMAIVDLDGDGHTDIVAGLPSSSLVVWLSLIHI